MKRLIFVLLLILIPSVLLAQGFGYKMITIHTNPSGAELFLNGKTIGESPATIRVQDGLLAPQNIVRAELDGYKTIIMSLDQHWKTGTTFASVCCGAFFFPGFALLIYAKEHQPDYFIYLQKTN